ncbi:endonuclease/exonuclease/phosphatase family protein [Sphingomonas adhaesiva]|uniref:Endonuclease n=1 Tax=Sphingomonas adhaesiva TaxID=28212 RepID=A0A2A4I2K9_9SPHN|nr:endonuclease/exonuclease/phosphatase family protein [Sphingomonas adhaesiva]PCG13217.1 endonuclease [Sphingomonas adhaesiva]
MPYYASLRREAPAVRARIAAGLLRLRQAIVDQGVPPRTLAGDVLIASWNIREFDSRKYGGRLTDAFYYIAEILSHFDLIAIQEVREDLSALERVQGLLGSWWKYVVTDVTDRALGGNGERMAFLYDSRKVTFGGLAGEIVLPPSKVDTEVLQFARTPFVCGFRAGWAKIDLCTVHIYYGESQPLDARRLAEIRHLAGFLSKRAKKAAQPPAGKGAAVVARAPEPDTMILLGDFNIFDPKDATLKAITDAGFVVPKVLTDRKGSNMGKDKFYDQIAVWRGKRFDETPRGGVFDFYEAVFRAEDEALYTPEMRPTKSGKPPKYKEWKTYQMSDHLVLWSAFKVDFAQDYLTDLSRVGPE